MPEDFYDVLGVSRDADEDEINRAFRKKAAKNHPDVSDDPDAEETFKKLQKAKEVLTDDEKRQMYDQLGHERFVEADKQGATDQGGARRGNPFGGAAGGGGMGGVGDIFDQFFGGGRGGSRPSKGQDLRTNLSIDLEEAYEGVTKQVTIRRPERCEDCNGTGHPPDADPRTCPECEGRGKVRQVKQTPFGRVQQTGTCPRCGGDGELYEETCSTCGGQGTIRREATLSVDVPAGIRSGQTLRMEREGAPGDRGAPDGDLLIKVSVEDHPDFERDGNDLRRRQPISFPQAVFGDTITVPTLDGGAEFEVPAGTQSGETFRLRGKGMPRLRGHGYGDLYVDVQIVTPESLSDEQREALEQFAKAGGESVDVEDGFFERIKNTL
ncbi:molecular chaperone DnaJ [Halanaeroarchaeum sulfurireducens]|uniref:Chaperone protein DnaJ n=1 Tax=Halanaeroarchaeum sulfurireducens TaxID=1604004 RepID=A0A0F7PCA8_9EURY|nr:molecular chaperone DnaJ [Halanaeroarchaeum sulfurireducens]AKH97249.1 molecular chaperone DnaJ [Halanaeroarchaeum sulfurireducens]ALG81651.1 molecular chaperone DnaJ [Halanaeroarchaeum sulfurireducens]